MGAVVKVYKLEFNVDDFCCLLAKDKEVHKRRLMALMGESKMNEWPESLEAVVFNEKAPAPDVICCDANFVLTQSNPKALREDLENYAEFLPVHWLNQSGHIVNIVGFTDCLDHATTTWAVHPPSGKKLWVEKFGFIRDKVPKQMIFKLKEGMSQLYTADHEDGSVCLKAIVEEQGLTGLDFKLLWEG
jgi:hypothetical protein